MLLYGGIGLLVGGLIILLFGNGFIKEADKAEKARKQAPILMLVGALMLIAWFYFASLAG